jgi:hypothetical protein
MEKNGMHDVVADLIPSSIFNPRIAFLRAFVSSWLNSY